MKNYKESEIWNCAIDLYKEIVPILSSLQEKKLFRLRDQLEASAGSISDNIAEGLGRMGNKEAIQFLAISNGSCFECENQITRAHMNGCIDDITFKKLVEACNSISRQTIGLIKYLKGQEFRGTKFK
jgi:four helix bundle protein